MKKLKLLKEMRIKGLSVIAAILLALVLWINFIDYKFNEISPGIGLKFERLVESLALSYIGAYFFYVLNIYLIERREKKMILPFISSKVFGIINNNISIINCLKNDSKINLRYFPSKEEFKELLRNVNPQNKVPFYYKNENWIFLFRNRQKSTINSINVIFGSGSKHIDEELRRILLELNNSLYLREDYAFNLLDFKDENLEKYHLVFFNYFKSINRLYNYYDKNLEKYYLIKNEAF